jgi:hypothetical protein
VSISIAIGNALLFGISWSLEHKGFGLYFGPFLLGFGWGKDDGKSE